MTPAADAPRRHRAADAAVVAGLLLFVALIYAQVREFSFLVWDDTTMVSDNPQVLAGLTAAGLRWAMTASASANWLPLTWLSHMLDVELFGTWAGGHHLVSVAWHGANTVLLYALLRRWHGTLAASAAVAALFAVHPLHVESVAWVAERKDVLSAFFWLLCLHAYAHYVARPSPSRYLGVTATFVLGLMAKPMLVSLPLILLLLDHWPHRRLLLTAGWPAFRQSALPLLREKLPWLALAATAAVIAWATQETSMLGGSVIDPALRVGNALRSYGVYLWMTLWPADLSYFYPLYPPRPWQVLLSSLVLAAATLWAWRERARRPWLLSGWLWFVVALLPVIGLVKIGAQAHADRYVYLPHIGLFVAVAWSLDAAITSPRWRRAAAATTLLAVVALAVVAWQQTRYWRDDESLYGNALRLDPNNYFAEVMLAETYLVRGPRERGEAMAARIVARSPGAAVGLTRTAFEALAAGRAAEALARSRAVVTAAPRHAPAWFALGLAQRAGEDPGAAIAALREALRLDPGLVAAWRALAAALAEAGQDDAAAAALAEAERRAPSGAPR